MGRVTIGSMSTKSRGRKVAVVLGAVGIAIVAVVEGRGNFRQARVAARRNGLAIVPQSRIPS